MKQIADGKIKYGEASLFRQHDGTLMCKMVAWVERPKVTGERVGCLRVRTAEDSLLIAANGKDERLWTYNADQVIRWQEEHKRQLERWSEDSKFEQRPVPAFALRRENAVEKNKDRIRSAIQMIAAELVGYAVRRKFAEVRYDDSCHEFAGDGFPYFALKRQIEMKCDEFGIAFASSGVIAKSGQVLAEGEKQ